MSTILDKIIQHKRIEVEVLYKTAEALQLINKSLDTHTSNMSFINKLEQSPCLEIIAEIKRGSPSKGLFAPTLDVQSVAKEYTDNGASAISVLTDKEFFYGSYKNLELARSTSPLPLLCKDFIIDEIQIAIAKAKGANLILLIANALDRKKLKALLASVRTHNMEVLVEIHNIEEYKKVADLDFRLLGINNRDLKTFNTDIRTSLELAPIIKKDNRFIISESGIHTSLDAEILAGAGIDGLLVGESLIRSHNRKELLNSLRIKKG